MTASEIDAPRMRVGIDYLPAVTHEWGSGRYARELVRALVRLPEAPELCLLEVGGAARTVPYAKLGLQGAHNSDKARLRRIPLKVPRRFAIRLSGWLGIGPERLAGSLDLFHHVQAPYLSVRGAQQVLTLAELPRAGTAEEAELARFARDMQAVLVFSRAFGGEVVQRLGVDERRVHAVAVGCDHWQREAGEAQAERSGPARFLVLGAVAVGRAPVRIVAAFERLIESGRNARLEFVGHPASAAEPLEQALASSAARAFVSWERTPTDQAMPSTMARTDVLVHLTRAAGTPITPLEACAAGAAVIATRLPVFEEVLGDQALWHAPEGDVDELTGLMIRACDERADESARRKRSELAANYSWERNARETLSLWRRVLDSIFEAPLPARDAP